MKKLFLLLIFLSGVIHAEYKDQSFSDKLDFVADKKDEVALNLFRISKYSQKTLNQSLHKLPSNAEKITVQLEGLPPGTRQSTVIYFSRHELQEMTFYQILERINRLLLKRTLLALGAKADRQTPNWLIAATTHQLQILKKSFLTQERFPMTRYSVVHNKFPDINTLIETKAPSPDNYWLYLIYAEQCSLLLEGLKREKQGRKNLISYYCTQSNTDFFSYMSRQNEKLSSYVKRKKWYEGICHKICFNTINPLPSKVIQKKVTKLFSIRVARPGNDSTRIPLEDITNQDNSAIDKTYIISLEVNFLNLLYKSSITLRPSLEKLFQSLKLLKAKEYANFQNAIIQAKAKFNKAIVFQAQLNQYLDELEKAHNKILIRYPHILKAQQLAEKKRRELFPQWQQYLNELEKKLSEVSLE